MSASNVEAHGVWTDYVHGTDEVVAGEVESQEERRWPPLKGGHQYDRRSRRILAAKI